MRRKAILALVAAFSAVAVVAGLSTAQAEPDQPAAIEQIIVDGVTVYRTERSDGTAVYELEPLTSEEAERRSPGVDPFGGATTGDLEACEFVAARPGNVNNACALVLAMAQRDDLDPEPGLAQVVHGVCGVEPGPGEVRQCEGQVATEAEVAAALQRLRDALAAG